MLLLHMCLGKQLLQYQNLQPLRRTGMELSRVSHRHHRRYLLSLPLDLMNHLNHLYHHRQYRQQVRRLCLNRRPRHPLWSLPFHLSNCSNHFRPLRSRSPCHLNPPRPRRRRRLNFGCQLSFLPRPRYLDH